MSMHKTTLDPGQLLRSVHMEKSYHSKAGYLVFFHGKFKYTVMITVGNPLLEVALGQ